MPVHIRPIRVEDAAAFLQLHRALDGETKFMMMEPGERSTTLAEQRKRIQKLLETDNGMIFVAEDVPAGADARDGGRLVGVLGAHGGPFRRSHDTVHIYIGILQAYCGLGIGRRLFECAEAWARGWGAHRLELTVMAHNRRALALYQKMGFTIEGCLRGVLKVDGQYIDEYLMSKLLE